MTEPHTAAGEASAPRWLRIIDTFYPQGTPLRATLMAHSRSVADLAAAIARARSLPLDPAVVEEAAMLHDIGICATYAPSIGCHGSEPYLRHGIIGAAMLRRLGVPDEIAAVAERHTGSGLTAAEIEREGLPLPHRDYLPESLLERLICYADKFYSKSGDMKMKPKAEVRASMERFGAEALARFDALHCEFAIPATS